MCKNLTLSLLTPKNTPPQYLKQKATLGICGLSATKGRLCLLFKLPCKKIS